MRYFAMIDGERRGPFELDQLSEAGVRPDTYVWCKGMADWEKAEDVADICRHFRRRIFDMMHPSAQQGASSAPPQPTQAPDPYADVPFRYREMVRRYGDAPDGFMPDQPDTSRPPAPTLLMAVLMTVFCFPLTGFVAIYYSYQSRRAWEESQRSDTGNTKQLYTDSEREELRRQAHDYDRQAKMWTGITFFLGMIVYALLGHKLI